MKLNIFRSKKRYCFAFYNIENLFDIYNDELKHDSDFTETAEKRLAEVENKQVLSDLVNSEALLESNYKFVHYDSKDERGIDVAMLYDPEKLTVKSSKIYSIELFDEDGSIDYTRDILHVYGTFLGEKVDILINHWPSRRSDNSENVKKRMIVSNKLSEVVKDITALNPNAKIIIMGDFNDDPSSDAIKSLVNDNQLFNPMDTLLSIVSIEKRVCYVLKRLIFLMPIS